MKLKASTLNFLILLSIIAIGIFVISCDGCGTPQPGKGGLEGSVYYYVAKTPCYVSGATVHIEGARTYSATTGSGGTYCHLNIDPSKYNVWAEDSQRASNVSSGVMIQANQKSTKDFVLSINKATAVPPVACPNK